jgi:hypothetical protein
MDSKKANGTVGSHRSAIELRAYVRCAQILLMMRQMDAAGTQALASKVSLVSLGQQAIMDAHLCLLHLTTGVRPDITAPCKEMSAACELCMGDTCRTSIS